MFSCNNLISLFEAKLVNLCYVNYMLSTGQQIVSRWTGSRGHCGLASRLHGEERRH